MGAGGRQTTRRGTREWAWGAPFRTLGLALAKRNTKRTKDQALNRDHDRFVFDFALLFEELFV